MDIANKIQGVNGEWKIEGVEAKRAFEFKDFLEAMRFVNTVAQLAQEADHHPDISISYNKVTLTLSTHKTNSLTQKDLDLARALENIAPEKA